MTPLSRDQQLKGLLRDVRRRHRQVQRVATPGVRANREAKRLRAVTKAELHFLSYSAGLAAHLGPKPSEELWETARAAFEEVHPNLALLKKVRWNTGEAPAAAQLRSAVTRNSVAYHDVIEQTRRSRIDVLSAQDYSVTHRLSRVQKKRMRREAREAFEAALAGLELGTVSSLNPRMSSVRTVAAGSTMLP